MTSKKSLRFAALQKTINGMMSALRANDEMMQMVKLMKV